MKEPSGDDFLKSKFGTKKNKSDIRSGVEHNEDITTNQLHKDRYATRHQGEVVRDMFIPLANAFGVRRTIKKKGE